jgi:chaperonin cofactor prefoldin
MEQEKANWNDDRLNHFAAQVDKRFEQVDKRFEQVDKRFDRLEGRMQAQSEHFDARFDSLQQAMIVTLAGIISALAAVVVAASF